MRDPSFTIQFLKRQSLATPPASQCGTPAGSSTTTYHECLQRCTLPLLLIIDVVLCHIDIAFVALSTRGRPPTLLAPPLLFSQKLSPYPTSPTYSTDRQEGRPNLMHEKQRSSEEECRAHNPNAVRSKRTAANMLPFATRPIRPILFWFSKEA